MTTDLYPWLLRQWLTSWYIYNKQTNTIESKHTATWHDATIQRIHCRHTAAWHLQISQKLSQYSTKIKNLHRNFHWIDSFVKNPTIYNSDTAHSVEKIPTSFITPDWNLLSLKQPVLQINWTHLMVVHFISLAEECKFSSSELAHHGSMVQL